MQSYGQVALSNGLTYQSLSAEAGRLNSSGTGSTPTYSARSYPMYGGYNGYYYGSPFYYGGSFGFSPSWRDLDDARHHGTSF
jgi:hypothetical protein